MNKRATTKKHLLPLLFSVLLFASILRPLPAQSISELDTGRKAIEAGDYSTAEQIYRKALVQTPSSTKVLTGLGLSLQMQGRSTEAIHYLSLVLKQQYIPETYALLAEERCHAGDLDSARPMLDRIYREQKNNIRVLSVVAPCYLDIDKPIESAIIYKWLASNSNNSADLVLVQLAKSYLRSGQFFVERLSKAKGSEPFLEAIRRASASGSSTARSAFAQAARLSPYFRADLDWTGAVDRWRQHANDISLLYLLAVLSGEEGMKQIELCSQKFPASPYLGQFYADILADQGHGDEAIAQYEQLLRDHPDMSDLRYSLGLLREKREQWTEAAAAFRQQLAAYPNDERAVAHLSKCMLQLEQYAALRDFLSSRMQAEHPPQWASLSMAEADEKLGDADSAIKILSAAEQDPDADKLIHYRLMHLYSISGRTADAKREFALFRAASRH
jgi:tetratricopeptide (TPR) repeat protein